MSTAHDEGTLLVSGVAARAIAAGIGRSPARMSRDLTCC